MVLVDVQLVQTRLTLAAQTVAVSTAAEFVHAVGCQPSHSARTTPHSSSRLAKARDMDISVHQVGAVVFLAGRKRIAGVGVGIFDGSADGNADPLLDS